MVFSIDDLRYACAFINDAQWERHQDQEHVRAAMHADDLDSAVAEMRSFHEEALGYASLGQTAGVAVAPETKETDEDLASYEHALSFVMARWAELTTPELWHFRDRHLGGQPVAGRDEAVAWLHDQHTARNDAWKRLIGWYSIHDRQSDETLPPLKGALAALDRLTNLLMARLPWTKEDATLFVLCGMTPGVRAITSFVWPMYDVPAARRVTLTVDPLIDESLVLKHYRTAKRFLLVEGTPRRQGPKQLALAEFGMAMDETKPWIERVKQWNERFPHWRRAPLQNRPTAWRSVTNNFQRDVTEAVRRLLGLGSNHPALVQKRAAERATREFADGKTTRTR